MADVEKLKFTCCGCFKTFVAKSGQGMRTVNCPYCGQVNTINTGKPKPEPEPSELPANFPIEQIVFNSHYVRGFGNESIHFPEQCQIALNSTFAVGDDVLLGMEIPDLKRPCVPAKITKFDIGKKFLSGDYYFDFAFRTVTGKDLFIKGSEVRVLGYTGAYTNVVFQYTTADRQDEIQEFTISKYRPEYYPEACRKAIQQQNEDGFTFP